MLKYDIYYYNKIKKYFLTSKYINYSLLLQPALKYIIYAER